MGDLELVGRGWVEIFEFDLLCHLKSIDFLTQLVLKVVYLLGWLSLVDVAVIWRRRVFRHGRVFYACHFMFQLKLNLIIITII